MAIKTGTAISLVGLKGPTGDQGQAVPALGSLCFAAGPQAYLSNVAGSANGVLMGIGGATAQPAIYIPPDASAFLGATIINYGSSSTSFVFALVNATANTVLWTSASYGANSINTVGVFTQTTYPMAKGAQYVWRCTNAGTIYAAVQPYYAMAANTAVAASQVGSFSLTPTTTLSSTYTTMTLPGAASTAYIRLPRSGYVYTYNVVNNAATAVSVRFVNASANTTLSTQTVAANSVASFGPYGPSTLPIAVNNNHVFQASGSGAADLQVQASVVS